MRRRTINPTHTRDVVLNFLRVLIDPELVRQGRRLSRLGSRYITKSAFFPGYLLCIFTRASDAPNEIHLRLSLVLSNYHRNGRASEEYFFFFSVRKRKLVFVFSRPSEIYIDRASNGEIVLERNTSSDNDGFYHTLH